ncbi:hypothetical protein [Sabulibacter ruber]|uniref:hypothetical protein n=1 Tax=Sabulibacter ruber TaxID=2811901 RepID=UPI001A96F362|nr:hypothetical protein [Sabulibacter ruber]
MKKLIYPFVALLLTSGMACSNDQKGTHSTTDVDAGSQGDGSPTAATSSAGSSGMGGSTSTHALASDTILSDSADHQ